MSEKYIRTVSSCHLQTHMLQQNAIHTLQCKFVVIPCDIKIIPVLHS